MMSAKKDIISVEKEQFLNTEPYSVSEKEQVFFKDIREEAKKNYSKLHFYSPKNEAWKYTNIRPFLSKKFLLTTPPPSQEKREIPFVNPQEYNNVFINGFYSVQNSSMDVRSLRSIAPMSRKVRTGDSALSLYYSQLANSKTKIFDALNTAYNQDGLYVVIPKFTKINSPVNAYFLSEEENAAAVYRNFFLFYPLSKSVINLYYISENESFTSSLSEIFVQRGAHVTINIIDNSNSGKNSHFNTLYIHQEEDTQVKVNTCTFNGELIRNDIIVMQNGENANTDINGVILPKETQNHSNYTLINHKKSNCTSNQLFKSVLMDSSVGVFNGKLKIFKDAQKINAYQTNNNIVCSEKATMNAKPELEIYADDVKCSHGSTTGKLNPSELFYLRSRGIPKELAVSMLVKAFVSEVYESIEDELLQEHIKNAIEQRIAGGVP